MKKLQQSAGLTLMELLAALLVLVLLVTAMGTGMDAALAIYRDSLFSSNSAALSGILNTALGDALRYAENIQPEGPAFTNGEYGIQNGRFQISEEGQVQIVNGYTGQRIELLNAGVYGGLRIAEFTAHYREAGTEASRGGYFEISYTISTEDGTKIREGSTIVRVLNPD